MTETAQLWLYFVVVFGVVVLPGMDMAFVTASALAGGRRVGMAAVAGVVAGGSCHLLMAATGLSLLLQWVPGAARLMLWGGAAYLAWIGFSVLRASSLFRLVETGGATAMAVSFRRAMLTNLLNPKAYLFMLAVFPQFVRTDFGPIWVQTLALGAITAATQAGVYGGLALVAAEARGWLADRPAVNRWLAQGVGLAFMLTAVLVAAGGLA